MAASFEVQLENLIEQWPRTEPETDGELYFNGPFLALSGIDVNFPSVVVRNGLALPGASVQNVFKAEMPDGPGFAKTSPFVIRSTIAYFDGDDGITPDQPFGIGRMPVDPQDTSYSIALWVHEVDYNPHGTYSVHERYDVVRAAGLGAATYWDYPSGDFMDSRRVGYAYEAFSNDLGDPTRGTLHAAVLCDQFRLTSNYCNPSNPSVGQLGDYMSVFPNQATGAVVLTVGTPLSENLQVTVSPTQTRLNASGVYLLDGAGTVTLQENDENLFVRLNRYDGATPSKQIEIYADGTGKSVRIGGSVCALTVTQSTVNVEGGSVVVAEGYNVTASNLRVRVGGLIDIFASDPGKMGIATGDGYTVLVAARDISNASYTMLGASAYHKSLTLKPDMRLGWGATVTDPATSGFRLNNGVVQLVNASDATIPFEAKMVLSPIAVPSSATASGSPGQFTFDANYLYLCTAENTWARFAKAAW